MLSDLPWGPHTDQLILQYCNIAKHYTHHTEKTPSTLIINIRVLRPFQALPCTITMVWAIFKTVLVPSINVDDRKSLVPTLLTFFALLASTRQQAAQARLLFVCQ